MSEGQGSIGSQGRDGVGRVDAEVPVEGDKQERGGVRGKTIWSYDQRLSRMEAVRSCVALLSVLCTSLA